MLSLRAALADMARLSDWVDEVATTLALAPRRLFALRLCAEELVTNVMMHSRAAVEGTTVAVHIRLVRKGDELRLFVEDDGAPFDPTLVAEPARASSLDDVQIGGLGLRLVRRFATDLSYSRAGGLNRIEVTLAG